MQKIYRKFILLEVAFWCMEESFDKVDGVIKLFLDILVDMLKTLNTKMLLKIPLATMKL